MALSFIEVQFSDGYIRTFTFSGEGADHFADGVVDGSYVTQVLLKLPGQPWVRIPKSEDHSAVSVTQGCGGKS
jgi:hypothetical protein